MTKILDKIKAAIKGDKRPSEYQIQLALETLKKAGGFKIIRLIENEKDIIL